MTVTRRTGQRQRSTTTPDPARAPARDTARDAVGAKKHERAPEPGVFTVSGVRARAGENACDGNPSVDLRIDDLELNFPELGALARCLDRESKSRWGDPNPRDANNGWLSREEVVGTLLDRAQETKVAREQYRLLMGSARAERWPADPAAYRYAQLRARLKVGFESAASDPQIRAFDAAQEAHVATKLKDLCAAVLARMPGARVVARDAAGYKIEWHGEVWRLEQDQGQLECPPPPITGVENVASKLEPLYLAFKDAGLQSTWPGTNTKADAPARGAGTGLHVDAGPFIANPRLLRDLVVLVHNEPWLADVFFYLGDHDNAIPIYEAGQQDQLIAAAGRIDERARAQGAYDFGSVLEELAPVFEQERNRPINLQNLYMPGGRKGLKSTLELRSMAAQGSPEDAAAQADFLAALLAHLAKLGAPLQPRRFDSDSDEWQARRGSTVARAAFRDLVRTVGLESARYERFLEERYPPPVRLGRQTPSARGGLVEVSYFDFKMIWGDTAPTRSFEISAAPEVARVTVDGREVALAMGASEAAGRRRGLVQWSSSKMVSRSPRLDRAESVTVAAYDARGRTLLSEQITIGELVGRPVLEV